MLLSGTLAHCLHVRLCWLPQNPSEGCIIGIFESYKAVWPS